ncbi:MAG: Uma2 family endonuclease [Xanthobacteraceae bacterium]
MARATQRQHAPLSVETFRAWAASRPDEEHWELIDGVPTLMTPATRDRRRVASNLERLLNDTLERHRPALAAYQRVGLNLGPMIENYDPEPDVAIVDANPGPGVRYSDRFYLAAEVAVRPDRWPRRIARRANIVTPRPPLPTLPRRAQWMPISGQ